MNIVAPSPEAIRQAAEALRVGELVAMPTETVYGLAADALDPDAVARVFALKGRPADHPLIVHLPSADHLTRWAAAVPKDAIALARAFWPGPLTLILRRDPSVPDEVTGGQDTVGLRVPAHPVAQALLQAFDSGLAAPSANRFGRISPTTAQHVADEFGDELRWILDGGACGIGIESTILDLSGSGPVILRPGAISADAIAAVIGRQPRVGADMAETAPRVSGSLAAHYAPHTPLELVALENLPLRVAELAGQHLALLVRGVAPSGGQIQALCAPHDAVGYAHDLYANLRHLDALGVARILVETPPESEEWQAVTDRLNRAAAGSGAEGA